MSDTRNDFTKGKTREHAKLDVEDEEKRQHRMHGMLMQLDSKAPAQPREVPRSFDFGERRTFVVDPPSELLSRVQAFLPEFAASTAEIARRAQNDPASVDIEKLNSNSHYIKMDLGLGVFEDRKESSSSSAHDSDTEMNENGTQTTSSDSTSDSDADSSHEYDSDSSVDIISSTFSSFAYERPIRPLPRRRSTRPDIVVLGEGQFTSAKETESPISAGESPA